MNIIMFLYLIPFILLIGILFLVGIVNMGYNVRYAYKSGNALYIASILLVTITTFIIGWLLGGLIG